MRKMICILLAILLFITAAITASAYTVWETDYSAFQVLRGDYDEDEQITIMDATRAQNVIAELIARPAEDFLVAVDADGDKELTIMDAFRIQNVVAKLMDMNANPCADTPIIQPETSFPTNVMDDSGIWVFADGKYYAVEPGQVITYICYLNTGEKVCSLDAETFYDIDGLTLLTDTEEEIDQLFPIIKDAMVLNDLVAGRLKYNYSSAKGKNFDNDDAQLIFAKFRVDAKVGVYNINTVLHTVAGANEHKYIFKDETLEELQRAEGLLHGIQPDPALVPPTEAPTEAPHNLWVVADGKYYAVEPQQEITYIYYLNTGEKVCSLDAETFYDTDGLTLLTDTEEETDQLFPIIKDAMVLNDLVEGRLKYSYSANKGKNFDADDAQLICAKFRVDAEEGVYHIDTFLHTVAGADEHKYIFKDETLDELQRSEGLLDGIEPESSPETDAPTQEPTNNGYDYSTIIGDVDGDGSVTIIDATCLQRYLAEICGLDGKAYKLVSAYSPAFTRTDVDGDKRLSIFDALRIRGYLANLYNLDGSPIGE